MEERLNAIGSVESSAVDVDNGGSLSAPRTDNLATLLTQGLLSSDKKMLNVSTQTRSGNVNHALFMAVESNVINCELPFTYLLDINGNLGTMQKTFQFAELIFIVGIIMCRFH